MNEDIDIVDRLESCAERQRNHDGEEAKKMREAAAEIRALRDKLRTAEADAEIDAGNYKKLREQVAALTAERDAETARRTAHFEDINAALTRAGVNLREIETYGGAIDSITAQRDAMVEALESVVKLDKTQYEHHEPRPDGTLPKADGGTCWHTPKQIARTALARIKRGGGA